MAADRIRAMQTILVTGGCGFIGGREGVRGGVAASSIRRAARVCDVE